MGTRLRRPCCLRVWCLSLTLFSLILLTACGGQGSLANGGGGSGSGGASGGGSSGGGGGNGGGSGSSSSGPFTGGRTKYVRTDATTEYFQLLNDHWILYNPLTDYIFVADPGSNRVIVLRASTQTEVGQISVPGAYTLDDTPDHSTIYVATVLGDVYTIDEVAMKVTNRFMGNGIGPSGFPAQTALVMADGKVALLGGAGGIGVDGAGQIALWNPADNSLTGIACSTFIGNAGGLSRTPDRGDLILSSVDSGPFCFINESTAQSSTFGPGGFPAVNFRISPNGRYLAVPFNTNTLAPNAYAQIYDLSTLTLVTQFPVSGDTSTAAAFAFSADSKTLYVPNDWTIYAYDVTSGQPVGWLPNISVPPSSGGLDYGPAQNPNLLAADNTGLVFGPMEEGFGFIDTTVMRTGPVGTQFTNGYSVPATGPVAGGTQVTITEPVTFTSLSGIYFGAKGSTDISGVSGPNTYGNFGSVSATAPSGSTGPTDIYVTTADGGMQLLPESFSYGPTILQITSNMSTAEGGGTGIIYGYGFGPVGTATEGPLPNAARTMSANTASLALQVTVGGTSVPVTGFAPYAYPSASPPFPLQALAYTIPPGTSAANVTITTSSGSASASAALSYLPASQQFSLAGSSLAQGIYDASTDLYYFTDFNQIQVFSRSLGWQTPIGIPGAQRLWGIALSPDHKNLAVADAIAGAIYLLDPTHPTSIKTFSTLTGTGSQTPCGVAVSDSGMVYFATVGQGIGGQRQFFKLDTNTGSFTNYGIAGTGINGDANQRMLIASDNGRVFFNNDGGVFYLNTATDQVTAASLSDDCCYGDYDIALSADQSTFSATGFIYDYNLQAGSYYALNDREVLNIAYVSGAKLSPDGGLLFQPTSSGIDVLDGKLGNLLHRIALPVSLSPNYDALVNDGTDNVLVAITGASGDGIAVVDLSSIQSPPPLPYTRTYSAPYPLQGASRLRSISDFLSGQQMRRTLLRPAARIPHTTNLLSRTIDRRVR